MSDKVSRAHKMVERKKCSESESVSKHLEDNDIYYDELLSSAGEFGKYQMILLLSTFPFYLFLVVVYYSQIFITEVSPNHWCWIPELANLTDIERRNLAIPSDDSIYGYSRCNAYVANWTEVLKSGLLPDESWDIAPCQNGWEFNKSEIPYPTIASDLGWVCDKGSYQATAQFVFSIGSIFGGFLVGWVADRFGRIPAVVAANLFGCIGGISSTYAGNLVQFLICRFIMGMAYDNCIMMVFILLLEYVSPKYRSIIPNATFAFFYTVFLVALPFLALALGHWKLISLVTSLPLSLAIFTPLLIPESPRWLLSKGRTDEAVKKILTIGRINGKEISPKLIDKFKWTIAKNENEENVNLIEVFKRPILRNMLILVCLEFMCCAVVFDGLVRTIGQLNFNFFLSFATMSFTELPSMLLVAFILDFFGRRWLTGSMMFVSFVFCFLIIFVGNGILSVIFAAIARFTLNMGYTAVTQWAIEVLPTGVRGSGASLIHICGFVSISMAPYIAYLNTVAHWLPMAVFGCITGLGAVIAMFLPETANRDLPHTFDDAELLAKNQSFFEMSCRRKVEKDSVTKEYVNKSFEC